MGRSSPNNKIFLGSFIHGGKQFYEFGTGPKKKMQNTFVYCVLANVYDMTREFDKMKDSIATNKTMTARDIITMLSLFFQKQVVFAPNDKLKIMIDDSFNELSFKANDTLLLHHE
jgi:hypothetical protein